ncbi:MAG: TetM/TetW/TetO/TetS family tetracycline resistance ribosomal protection protein [Clostridia bacterium]|nr:TetM/TetW/TetO/TetS family tetracycline resistance ribosomal protection protein [Clostridia bacterium]
MKRLVMGILAHVDSGKTTLAEALLFETGTIRSIGRVDHKNAFLDNHSIERERGITIFSKQAIIKTDDIEFSLLDTPGHVDFSTEAERTLGVLDYAILVISGAEGIQSHTETLWNLLKRYKVPTFIFVNKMDLTGTDRHAVLCALQQKLDSGCVDFSREQNHKFYEDVAMCDESLLQEFLENNSIQTDCIANAILNRRIFPCFFGSALKNDGVNLFYEGLKKYTVQSADKTEFGARVFKISEDNQGNRLTHVKITGGEVNVKDLINYGKNSEKINQIRIYSGTKFNTVDKAYPGMVCALTGLSGTFPGQGLGCEKDSKRPVLEPVLSYKAEFPEENDLHTAYLKMKILEQEDPSLKVVYNERLKEIHVWLMGEVQIEVLSKLIKERFNMSVIFGQGSIAYKETISLAVEGVGHYEPLRHYAEVHLILEPLPPESGIVIATDLSEDELDKNWQRLILTHLAEKSHLGVLTGSPVTDIKITLASGKAHLKHTEGGDFRQATYRAVRHGLMKAKSVLLEPWYDFVLELPSALTGRAMTDLTQMNAEFGLPETDGEYSVLRGIVPVRTSRDYHLTLNNYSGGKGKFSVSHKGYLPCIDAEKIIAEINYNPLSDTENPADSVFCSHGAGFTVPWNEVEEHMHLESVLKTAKTDELQPARVKESISRIVADKELMQIFERTYGKVKRREDYLLHTPHTTEKKNTFKGKPLPKGPEYVLVDGYNVIFAWEFLKNIAETSLEMARDKLIEILCGYRAFKDVELIVVFDAYKVKNNKGSVDKIHDVYVVYTKEAETADMYIEKTTHQLAKKHRVRVVTSDSVEQLIILGAGALRIPASAFLAEVRETEAQIRKFLS